MDPSQMEWKFKLMNVSTIATETIDNVESTKENIRTQNPVLLDHRKEREDKIDLTLTPVSQRRSQAAVLLLHRHHPLILRRDAERI